MILLEDAGGSLNNYFGIGFEDDVSSGDLIA